MQRIVTLCLCMCFPVMLFAIEPPYRLRCEGTEQPLNIQKHDPLLSWYLVNDYSGTDHVSWQIQAASSLDRLLQGRPDLWDSSWRPYHSLSCQYEGERLNSYAPCFWRVRSRTGDGRTSEWSEPAMFRMGVLAPEDWLGRWIGYSEPLPGVKTGPTARDLDMSASRWIWVEEDENDFTPLVYCPQGPKGYRYIFSKEFDCPSDQLEWAVLRMAIDGVATEVYINGVMVELVHTSGLGLSNSWTMPVEIDVSNHVKTGKNILDVSILRRSGGLKNGFQALLVMKGQSSGIHKTHTDRTWSAAYEPDGGVRRIRENPLLFTLRSKRQHHLSWEQHHATPMMRRDFAVKGPVVSAIVSVSGLGFYELSLNGERVGDRLLEPAFTNYNKRVLYSVYNLTDMLHSGTNTLGLILANGWYNHTNHSLFDYDIASWRDEPKAILQLRIEYADGSIEWVATDEKWKAARSPVVLNGIFNGQVYDARLEQAGWDIPGFDDSTWNDVNIMTPPSGILASTQMPPERVIEILEAEEITETIHHSFIFKFPKVTSGVPRLKVSGPAGTRVVMRSFEVFDDRHDSHVNRQGPFQTDTYILKGEGVEYFEPGFAYHGLRYIELTGYPGEPTVESLTLAVVHTDFEMAGSFTSSSEVVNSIQRITLNSYLTNYHGLPLDCPTREKSGWTADGYLAAETGLFNFDAFNAHSKWIDDMLDCQDEEGRIPDIVPTASWGYNGHFDWDCVIIYMPWYNYLYTGNEEILARSFEAMKACYDHYYKLADDGILMRGRGDHGLYKTPTYRPVTITAILSDCARIIAKVAGILNDHKSREEYEGKASFVRNAFIRDFLNEDGTIANGSQTAQSCALYYNLLPDSMREKVLEKLIAAIERSDTHIDFGIFGAKYLFPVLSEHGYHDLAFEMITQETYPGYGWCVSQGFTALPQYWDLTGTFNHIMFGDVSAWFYRSLAGIKPVVEAPGFKEFMLQPRVNVDLDHVHAEYLSPYGKIVSRWQKNGGEVEYHFEVPANTRAHVLLEGEPISGPAVEKINDNQYACTIGTGTFVFKMKQHP